MHSIQKVNVIKMVSLAAAVTLTACGGGGGAPLSESTNPLGLDGEWLSNCYAVPNTSDFEQTTFRFNGFGYSSESKRYSRNDCSGTADSESRETGTFSVGTEIVVGSGVRATEINFNVASSSPISRQDIVRVDNNQLNFGIQVNGNTRPTDLNFTITYRRQP